MSTVTMDGIIAYALSKKHAGGGQGGAGGAVTSVNGQVGKVVLTANDVDAYSKQEIDTTLEEYVRDVEYKPDSKTLVITKKDTAVSNLDLSGLAGVNLKREKLTVQQDGQTEFITKLDAKPTDLASIYYYLLINGQEYIDNTTLKSVNGKAVVIWDNIFDLEISDSVYMYYFLLPTISGDLGGVTSVNGQTGAVILNAGDVNAYTKQEVDVLIGAGGGQGGAVTSVNGEFGDVQITPAKLNVYTKDEANVLLDAKVNKVDLTTELDKKVNTIDYDAYKASNDTKVNASIKKIAFIEASKELTITKTDDRTEKVDLSSLGNGTGGGSLGLTSREW